MKHSECFDGGWAHVGRDRAHEYTRFLGELAIGIWYIELQSPFRFDIIPDQCRFKVIGTQGIRQGQDVMCLEWHCHGVKECLCIEPEFPGDDTDSNGVQGYSGIDVKFVVWVRYQAHNIIVEGRLIFVHVNVKGPLVWFGC